MDNGKTRIIVDEIPYQVNKAMLIMQIADRVKEKEIEGITDLRDESDRHGMRVVIELHKDAIPQVVLENLWKKTNMEITYGVINIALVDNKPTLLGLKELIVQYIKHRKSVVTRRTQYELDQAAKRFHILEGLMKAINMLDETIALIRESADGEAANLGLQNLLGIDQEQAKSILDMRLQKLTGLELNSIKEEYDQLIIQMNDLKDILAHEQRVLNIIKDELKAMSDAYGDERRTEIDPNEIDADEEDLIPNEKVVVTVSNDNYIKRIPLSTYRQQSRGGVGLTAMQTKEEDHVASMFVMMSHDYILFITNKGRMQWLKGYRIPEGSRQAKGKPLVNLIPDLEEDEKIINSITTREFPDDKYLVFCTKNGLFKKTVMSAYGNVRARGIKAIKLDEGDELIGMGITDGSDQIIIASADGQAVRFDETDARPLGRDTMGVKGMTLSEGDRVVSMAVVKSGDRLLTVSENGYGKISDVDDYRKTKRGGKGVITIKTDERNGKVVSVTKVDVGDELMLQSKSGKIIRMQTDTIRETGRNAKGVRVMDLRDGDTIIAVEPVMSEDQDIPEEPAQEQEQ